MIMTSIDSLKLQNIHCFSLQRLLHLLSSAFQSMSTSSSGLPLESDFFKLWLAIRIWLLQILTWYLTSLENSLLYICSFGTNRWLRHYKFLFMVLHIWTNVSTSNCSFNTLLSSKLKRHCLKLILFQQNIFGPFKYTNIFCLVKRFLTISPQNMFRHHFCVAFTFFNEIFQECFQYHKNLYKKLFFFQQNFN